MTITEIKTRYQDNIEIIRILKEKLSNSYGSNSRNEKEQIIGAIELVKKEQIELNKAIEIYERKKRLYKTFNERDLDRYKVKNDKDTRKEESAKEIVTVEKEDEPIDEIVLDKDSVKVTKVEEPKVDNKENIKVINITEKAPDKIEQLAINVKKEKEKQTEELKDAKVVFDGTFKLVSNGKVLYEQEINDVLLDHNMNDDLKPYNYNIKKLLKDYDLEHDTNLFNRYIMNDIKVEYNFDKVKDNDKRIKKIKKLSKKEDRIFSNVTINEKRKKRFRKGLTFIAAAGLLMFGGLNIAKNISKTNSNTTAQTNSVVANAGPTDADIEVITTEEEVVTAKPATPEKNVIKDDIKVEPIVETKVETKNEEVKPTEEKQEENLRVGDKFDLESVDLYYASTDPSSNEGPRGNTSNLEKSPYEASLIAVVYNNQVMKLVYNDSIDLDALESVCKAKYGDDISIFFNFNKLDEDGNVIIKNVGWVPKDQVLSKGKVLTR